MTTSPVGRAFSRTAGLGTRIASGLLRRFGWCVAQEDIADSFRNRDNNASSGDAG
jgi:hypothetical protein